MKIRFGNWQPDLMGLTNDGVSDAKNVYPTGRGGYAPVKDIAAISTTGLSAKCQGAFAAQDTTGTTNTFAGDASKLYRLSGASFGDVSKVGGYTVSSTEMWEFAQFGQNVIATQIGNPVQNYLMASSSIFADLGGSPPSARHIAIIKDFVVLGNTSNSPSELFWSEFNNSAGWTTGTNQCDSQTLTSGGWVHRVMGGEVGWVFQENAVTRMTYVGPPVIFQLDPIDQAPGLVTPGAIHKVGDDIFYYSQVGFIRFNNGGFEPIGDSKVDNWFRDHIAPNTTSLITASDDPSGKYIFFSFVSTDATDASHPDTILIYNRYAKEWSYTKIDHELIYTALSEGYTLETLSAVYPVLENVPVSFDSRQWTGGANYLGIFTTGHQLASLTGSNLAALIETADLEPVEGRRSQIDEIKLGCDTSSATIKVRSRERFPDSVTDTSATAMQTNGSFGLQSEGAYHKIQTTIPAGSTWTFATGLEFNAQDAGYQ